MGETLYVSDLDRTLLNSEIRVSKRTEEVINDLISEGMKFTIATARSWYSASEKVKSLDLTLPVSIYNGSFIIDPVSAEAVDSKEFEKNESKMILDKFIEGDVYPLVYSFIHEEEKVSWLFDKENQGIKKYLAYRQGDERLRKVGSVENLYDGKPFYFSAIDKKEKLEDLIPFFERKESLSYHFQKDLNSDDYYWLEVKHCKADKASSVKRIKEITRCSKVVSFGDDLNDIPMFSISDEAYAVSNANPELKERATGIIPISDEDGVAGWLMKNLDL
ncbi:MAG: HAD-IIB family hydrolase [Candidatus Thermoplasmatota archaeon]|nr:HAD-IIB family hydrolase [Candidatus Thermoplasmatota archaeon]MBS3790796.1 HAD-IIB family hydrolase [Candidatus Thermoplasmatota archaeon]